jgi:hypothetical protein
MQSDYTEQYVLKSHIDLGFDAGMGGVRLFDIDDLELLSKWFSLFPLDTNNDKMFCALWIRINQLHPKFLLRIDEVGKDQLLEIELRFN